MKRVVTPVSAAETGLQAFLESVGFTHTGVMREALYLHGEYQDVYLYAITADTLT